MELNKDQIRVIYEDLLEDGVLQEMYPDLVGDWSKDCKEFCKIHDQQGRPSDFIDEGLGFEEIDFDL